MITPRIVWLALPLFASCTEWRGITVTLENASPRVIESVVVHVTGRSSRIGDLAPHEQRSVRVQPTGDSHVEIERDGSPDRLVLDTYFEPGYRQHVQARITNDVVLALQVRSALP